MSPISHPSGGNTRRQVISAAMTLPLVAAMLAVLPAGASQPQPAAANAATDPTHIDERCNPFEPMQSYAGLIPTDEAYNDWLAHRLSAVLATNRLDGLVLDFLRWPGHWALELRPGARPRHGSYDPITLRRFRRAVLEAGHNASDIHPADPVGAAAAVRARHAEAWTRFRCDVIDETTDRLAQEIRSSGRWVGMFVVPASDEVRRTVYGQDTHRLGRRVDALLPMTHHATLRKPPSWVRPIADNLRVGTDVAVVPVVQATSTVAHSAGHDWGPPVDPAEFGRALRHAGRASARGTTHGFCVFPGESLDTDRLDVLARQLSPDGGD